MFNWLKQNRQILFSLDRRSLALMRIGFGLVLIFDVIQKKLYPTANEFQAFFKQGMRLTFLSENTHLPNAASENDLDKYENNIVLAKNHNIHHRLYIAEGRKDHVRLGGFAIDENKQSIFEFYLNSVDVLENFIVYFESKIETLLSKKKNHKKDPTAKPKEIKILLVNVSENKAKPLT